jgi:hypothetical protein
MPRTRTLQAFDYVNQPYEAVRALLCANPRTTFHDATAIGAAEAARAELRAYVGAAEIAAEVEIDVISTRQALSSLGTPTYSFALAWSSPRRPNWFPTMQAALTISSLSPGATQLDLDGAYVPPLGLFGVAVDAVALHRFAEAAVAGFVRELAIYLRDEISLRRAEEVWPAPAMRLSP